MMNPISEKGRIDSLSTFYSFPIEVAVLRLDLVHPVISGNKWFKLKEYLNEAKHNNKNTLLTYGGAFSNHIVATAAAARVNNFKSIGIIRGEKPSVLSPSLQDALHFGMSLFFVSRDDYKQKKIPAAVYTQEDEEGIYVIPEGGYGPLGAAGASAILLRNATSSYSHILLAVGTGTTLAGIITGAKDEQKLMGVPVLKSAFSLQQEIEHLLPQEKEQRFTLIHDYHFGGYAKYNNDLLHFMNELYFTTAIPTDFVYTAKAFYAAFDLLNKNYFSPTCKLLIVHTGGLQGNRSLKKGTLIFE
jgi:1-aminocyclopropane-1-carboxylate deaminase